MSDDGRVVRVVQRDSTLDWRTMYSTWGVGKMRHDACMLG